MSFDHLTSPEVLKQLSEEPGNFKLLQEVANRSLHPDHASAISNGLLELSSLHHKKTWKNCIDNQTCNPNSIQYPRSKDDLITAVNTAKKLNLHVRIVGSGHSFSNVCLTDGILLDPHKMKSVLTIDKSQLKNPNSEEILFAVESGITIKDLNKELDHRNLALENMGAYAGQTLAGAISTGTHGTGIGLGNIASFVRSLTLVSSNDLVYQIEPTNGITDPLKFSLPNVILKQDDAWFNTTLISMGCTGLIYSYVLAVVPAFHLQEFRTMHYWEDLKNELANGDQSPELLGHKGYELDLNPYTNGKGKHSCIKILHNDIKTSTSSGSRGFLNWLSGVFAAVPAIEYIIVEVMNGIPTWIPWLLTSGLQSLETPSHEKNGYIDKSYNVLLVGAVVDHAKAYALELSAPCDKNLVANIDKLLTFLSKAREHGEYESGPIALRFVAPSTAYLSPQVGRSTCMIELDMLVGVNKSKELLIKVKEHMCTPNNGIRVHWGLDPEDGINANDLRDWYPDLDKWMAVYRELNADGMWNSPLTDRIGISIPKK
jgi:L-gulono-1,4-lactone dehydrogenase